MFLKKMFKPTFYFLFLSLMLSCSSDDDSGNATTETYSTDVYVTDAPTDNPEVSGVFMTIAEVRVNGVALDGFQKTTVELSSLTEGTTRLLGNVELEAGNTSDIVLVLDGAADASGNAPGNYVLTTTGEKRALSTAQNSISLNDSAEILASNDNELILDFDLRKSITQNTEGNYSFVSAAQLSNSIRAVNDARAGTIAGEVSNQGETGADALVVYAYEAGSYSESETQADGNGLQFTNAVSSTTVNQASGDFSLHFIEEGNYELVFASYADEDNDGSLEFQGQVEMSSEVNLDAVVVEANSTVNVSLSILGFLNF